MDRIKQNQDEIQRRRLQEYIFGLEEMQERAEDLAVEHEQLQRSQNLLNAILAATTHGICLIKNDKFVWCNQGLTDIFGWNNDELDGKTAKILFADAKAYESLKALITDHSSETEIIAYESEFIHKNGSHVPCLVTHRPLDSSDISKGSIFSFTDFSERKRAEEALKAAYDELEDRVKQRTRELHKINQKLNQELAERKRVEEALRDSEEKYRTVLESNPDPVVVYDMDGKVTYLNPAFERVFGWTLEERLGQKMAVFVPEETWPETQTMIDKVKTGESFSGIETRRYTKKGDIMAVSISGSMYRHEDGQIAGTIVTLRDISSQKKLEYQLQQARKLEAVGTLAGGIAHDFNNLLMGLQGNVSLMLFDTDRSNPQYEKLEKIEQYIQRGTDLTRQLLGFARGGKYEVKATDLNELLKNSARMFARTKKEINVHQEFTKNLGAVEVDQGQIEQVLLNLFVNAWQAMPRGGDLYLATENVTLDEEYIQPYELKPGSYAKISVTDTGIGMDKETQKKIFDPFFTTKEMGVGTGLGLASVYGIIKNHEGFINVYSEKGQGTTFNIYLPISSKEISKSRKPPQELSKGTETILLVDDEEMIIEIGQEILQTLGYQVIAVKTGQEALEIYGRNQKNIDMVILDMVMPGLGGGETFDGLKKINPDIKVLLSSGYSINGEARKILDRGCDGFIQKPFNIKQLAIKLREILETI